eukprot:TRINITY_DN8318_c0_g1_i1.p1 TRINITY_DN8318_c0_g1~~TRINITY_DN8318_c0_g1_i1.p1  ORF type:complete len:850 (-),score=180.78 TRINITY_DN8318_c0_g1_i1:173-2722(-)
MEDFELQLEIEDIPFEEVIARNRFSLKAWWAYLEHKKSASNKDRNLIYERALKELPGSYKLWSSYLRERRDQARGRKPGDSAFESANHAHERALVYMNKMPRIWMEYCQFLVDQKKITSARRTFDRALKSLPITQHDRIWPLYLDFVRQADVPETAIRVFRRYLKIDRDHAEEYIEYLKTIGYYQEASHWLAELVNDQNYVSPTGKTKHQLWLELCDIISKYPEKIDNLKVDAIIRSALAKYTDEVGTLWTSLADYYIRLGHFEKARDVLEEGINSVMTVRDFSIVFDAYTQFEESVLSTKMENAESNPMDDEDDFQLENIDLDLRLARLENLMNRRPELVNSVLLRQNPHNVHEWLKRVEIFKEDPAAQVGVYVQAVKTVDPEKAVGKANLLWIKFAKHYEDHDDLANARVVFDKAAEARYKTVDDLAQVWCEYAEMELRHKNFPRAIQVMQRATRIPAPHLRKSFFDEDATPQQRLYKSLRVWSLYVDLEESLGTYHSTKAVYDQIMDLSIATPQVILNYASFLEGNKYFEESFKIFERGVSLFSFPIVKELWIAYLNKFVARYGGKKLERARDLFEQVLEKAPTDQAKDFYLLYAKLEEDHGLARHAMNVYHRAVQALPDDEKMEIYSVYISRAAEYFGVISTREIYEKAIELLPDKYAKDMCLRFADLERKLGEIDRARAVFAHGAQFTDPRLAPMYWQSWHEFEVQHGNPETYREMLRIKRSVQAHFSTTFNFVAATDTALKPSEDQVTPSGMEALEGQVRAARNSESSHTVLNVSTSAQPQFAKPQGRITAQLDDEDEDDDDQVKKEDGSDDSGDDFMVEEKSVPSSIFGGLDKGKASGGKKK